MWSKAKIMRLAERTLKRTEAYRENHSYSSNPEANFHLDCVLVKGGKFRPDTAIAYAHYQDEMIMFDPFKDSAGIKYLWDWSFSFDGDLFMYLEQSYELAGMSLSAHYAAWMEITGLYDDESINFIKGMQRHLKYCKQNQVTRELLCKEFQYQGMDVITLYDKSAI